MSLTVIYTVTCDECMLSWVGQELQAKEARRLARKRGWLRLPGGQHGGKFNGGRDLCPACAAKVAQ